MPVDLARRLCPALRLVSPDPPRTRAANRYVQSIAARFAPVWEPVLPGHLFLDLTGTQRLWGPAVDTAVRIEREVRRSVASAGVVGIGTNKLVSDAAVRIVQPPECYEVRSGDEQTFLAPLPITLLPRVRHAFSRKVLAILEDLNLRTLGAIADIPLPVLEPVLGSAAGLLHDWAHGIDPSPVLPPVQQPCLERSLTVTPDEIDDGRILSVLYGLLEQLCRTLRRQRRACGHVRVSLLHSDQVESCGHQRIRPSSQYEADLYPHVRTLFFRCMRRRIRVRRVMMALEDLRPVGAPGEQLLLFDDAMLQRIRQRERWHRLAQALDRVRDRFGERAIYYGRPA